MAQFTAVRRIIILLPALLPLLAARVQAQQVPLNLFPRSKEISGWSLKSGPVQFLDNKLFDYMDGAAEIPKSYGFRALGSARYTKDGTILELAVFDMGSAAAAYGYYGARVFLEHSPRSKERMVRLDHPAHIYSNVGVLTMWKDRYTVILQPDDGKPDDASLLEFAKFVSSRINAKGAEPDLLTKLPGPDQIANTARFIRGKAAFDATVMFTARDLFGMSSGPDAVAAEYNLPGGPLSLVIIKYSGAEAAKQAVSKFRQIMTAGKAQIGTSKLPGAFVCLTAGRAKGTGVAASGNYVLLTVGAKDASSAASALAILAKSLGVK